MIPTSLRMCLVGFFLCLVGGAVPLLIIPAESMQFVGFAPGDLFVERLLGASMLGIGGVSLVASCAGRARIESAMLLNVVWSGTAVFGSLLSMDDAPSCGAWCFLLFFAGSCAVWLHWLAYLAQPSR